MPDRKAAVAALERHATPADYATACGFESFTCSRTQFLRSRQSSMLKSVTPLTLPVDHEANIATAPLPSRVVMYRK
jgi:hypothetical protein